MSVDSSSGKLRVLIVEDNHRHRHMIMETLYGKYEYDCAVHFQQAREKLSKKQYDLVLLDLMLPEKDETPVVEDGSLGLKLLKLIRETEPLLPVVIVSAMTCVLTALKILQEGIVDYIVKDDLQEQLPLIQRRAELIRKGRVESLLLRRLQHSQSDHSFIYASPKMAEIDEKISKIATVDASVLLLGESGTGKDVIAREIHRRSSRANDPFIDVNCGAIPESLIESELFGCEKGAFTGADRTKPGLFEAANNGTLFLDEIADLSLTLQVKLLRVLQERTFRRVGGTKLLSSNVRIIAATNKDLQEERSQKRFRDDLYYRLNKIVIVIPPLRERPEDIEKLSCHFLKALNENVKHVLLSDSVGELMSYSWPGNIRELENVMFQLSMTSPSRMIEPMVVRSILHPEVRAGSINGLPTLNLAHYEQKAIVEALRLSKSQGEAAKLLGISLSSLRRKIDFRMRQATE